MLVEDPNEEPPSSNLLVARVKMDAALVPRDFRVPFAAHGPVDGDGEVEVGDGLSAEADEAR